MSNTIRAVTILSAAITTDTGTGYRIRHSLKSVQAWGLTTAGAGAATIDIEGSYDGTYYVRLFTITLTLATTVTFAANNTDGYTINAPWLYVRARVTAISGTNAAVTVGVSARND